MAANLSNPDNIQFTSSQKLAGQGADIINVIQNKLFLYGYSGSGGIIIYSLANPLEPGFETFYRTDYYPGKIAVKQQSLSAFGDVWREGDSAAVKLVALK